MKNNTFWEVTSVYWLHNLTFCRTIFFLATRKRHRFWWWWWCGNMPVSTETATRSLKPQNMESLPMECGLRECPCVSAVLIHSSVQIWIHHKRKQSHPCVCKSDPCDSCILRLVRVNVAMHRLLCVQFSSIQKFWSWPTLIIRQPIIIWRIFMGLEKSY
jgi:hypothetical protein